MLPDDMMLSLDTKPSFSKLNSPVISTEVKVAFLSPVRFFHNSLCYLYFEKNIMDSIEGNVFEI